MSHLLTPNRDLPPTGAGTAAKPKTYRVLYAVTRGEWYEIDATTAAEAERRAYEHGRQVDRHGVPCETGDAHDVIFCELVKVPAGGAR